MGLSRTFYSCLITAVLAGGIGVLCGYRGFQHEGFRAQEDVSAQFEKMAVDSARLPIAGSPVKGAPRPKAVVVVFADFDAPGMRLVHRELLDEIFRAHGGEVAVVYKAYPMNAAAGSGLRWQAAYAAHRQDKFWEMADALIPLAGKPVSMAEMIEIAGRLKLDKASFEADFGSRDVRDRIRKDIETALANGVNGSPAVFVNGRRVQFETGAASGSLTRAVNAELRRVNALAAQPGAYYFAASAWNARLDGGAPEEPPTLADEDAQDAPARRTFVDIDGTPAVGSPDALVNIAMFADFECPFSAVADRTIRELMSQYPGKIRLSFKHHPMKSHPHADDAHRAAEAASLMGRFWEMHALIFEHQDRLEPADLEKYAAKIGLDASRFKSLLDSDSVKNRIAADLRQARSAGVPSAPGLFVNGIALKGAPTLDALKKIVDGELALAERYLAEGAAADDLYKSIIAGENAKLATREEKTPERLIVLTQGRSHARGAENAPVAIYMFADFQCPFSRRAESVLRQVMDAYGDEVRVVFKNFPLDFHKDARLAAEAALAAGAQGKFWEMHDVMFKNQKNLTRPALTEYAKWAGLDTAKFDEDLDSGRYADQLDEEIAEGKSAGILGTPAFVVNGKLVIGAKPFEDFRQDIDAALMK